VFVLAAPIPFLERARDNVSHGARIHLLHPCGIHDRERLRGFGLFFLL
jgi:hypothetical protein